MLPQDLLEHSIYLHPDEVQMIIRALELMPSDEDQYKRAELVEDLRPYTS